MPESEPNRGKDSILIEILPARSHVNYFTAQSCGIQKAELKNR